MTKSVFVCAAWAVFAGSAKADDVWKLPDAKVGKAYTHQIRIDNPDKLALHYKAGPPLPPGIVLSDDGILSGKPTAANDYQFQITVSDGATDLVSGQFSMKVVPPSVKFLPQEPNVHFTDQVAPGGGKPDAAVRDGADGETPQDGASGSGKPPAPRHCAACAPMRASAVTDKEASHIVSLQTPITVVDTTLEGDSNASDVEVKIERGGVATATVKTDSTNHFSYTVPDSAPLRPFEPIIACVANKDTTDTKKPDVCTTAATVQTIKRTGEQARAVMGFQQVGASGADSTQKFFFDFYISRPVPLGRKPCCDSHIRWWGNVRIGSAPRQIDSPVSTTALRTSAKSLKFNELAQAAEFLSGLEFRFSEFKNPLWGQSSNSRQRFTLGFIVGAGATGSLTAEKLSNSTVFNVPDKTTDPTGFVQFKKAFPAVGDRTLVSFVPPNRDHFFREYFGGFRLTSHYADRYGTASSGPPAMVSVTIGQNELVSGGRLHGLVNRIEAFYPLSTGRTDLLSSVYLFGTAQLQLTANPNNQVFFLQQAMNPPADGTGVAYIAAPSKRDVYTIGLGLDLVSILKNLKVTWKP